MSYRFLGKRNGVQGQVPPLGSLELQVMDRAWRTAPVSAQDLHAALEQNRDITLSTVQSTVERLCRKGLLTREKQGRAYLYVPALERGALITRMLADLIGGLGGSAVPASGFVNTADPMDTATLDLLENWLAACRRSAGSEPAV